MRSRRLFTLRSSILFLSTPPFRSLSARPFSFAARCDVFRFLFIVCPCLPILLLFLFLFLSSGRRQRLARRDGVPAADEERRDARVNE